LTIGVTAAAIAALVPLPTGGTERLETANYERGARIIQVLPRGEREPDWDRTDRRGRASFPTADDDDDLPAPAPRRAIPAKPRGRTEARPPVRDVTRPVVKKHTEEHEEETQPESSQSPAARNAPRWKLRSDAPPPPPPPSGPRRAVLSAPPPQVAGPTPLRPTPDFESDPKPKVYEADKIAGPAASEVSEIVPPRGYKPPPPAVPAVPESPVLPAPASEDTAP
jgi:hypothetical protein